MIDRRAMRAWLWLVVAMFVGAACGIRAGASVLRRGPRVWERGSDDGGPSRAIYPTQRIPLRFDHRQHLAIGGVTCERCHRDAASSDRVSDRLLPDENVCASCHSISRAEPTRAATPAARCDACHVGFDPARPVSVARVEIPPANLRFSHRRHAGAGVRCEDCHRRVREGALATRLDLPTMRECTSCHAQRGASTRCASCHLTEADGVLRTRFEEGWLNPPSWMNGLRHDADFWVNHRSIAQANPASCNDCHRERECVDCHDGRMRDRRTHPNDYLTFHGVEARMAADRCSSCHREQTFCEGCHRRAGVALSSAPAARGGARFHPPFAVFSGANVTFEHHAMEARRSLQTCVSCHAERDCTSCHAVRGLGGAGANPHPPGFGAQCGALLRASSRGCAGCHQDLASLAARCP
ncbi:MAG: hypothetical protein JNK05_18975 [Myxococcales bacterium]|nr:hypothetical protein [Myxococcales bacterium]